MFDVNSSSTFMVTHALRRVSFTIDAGSIMVDDTTAKSMLPQAEKAAVDALLQGDCVRLFVSGAVSHVGKTTVCLAVLGYLEACGISTSLLAYIKPATQCEADDSLALWCRSKGVRHVGGSDAPLVFYPGLTRSVISGETAFDIANLAAKVEETCEGKRFCVIDGVGFPGVGSCVGASNADVARACRSPVVLVGKAGVGSAIDTHCLDTALFEASKVPVLGAIFNMADSQGYYTKEKIIGPIETYFRNARPRETCYGIVPSFGPLVGARDGNVGELDVDAAVAHLVAHVDFKALIEDAALDVFNRKRRRPLTAHGHAVIRKHEDRRSVVEARARIEGASLTAG